MDDDVQQLTDELCRRQERRAKQDAEEKEKQKAESGKWPEVHSALAEKCPLPQGFKELQISKRQNCCKL